MDNHDGGSSSGCRDARSIVKEIIAKEGSDDDNESCGCSRCDIED